MKHIVSVEADAELVRITVVWRGGYKQSNINNYGDTFGILQ